MLSQKWIRIAIVMFVFVLVWAWIARPMGLGEKIAAAGIHLKRTEQKKTKVHIADSRAGYYTFGVGEGGKLRALVLANGYTNMKGSTIGSVEVYYRGVIPFLPHQVMLIDWDATQTTAVFDPDINVR